MGETQSNIEKGLKTADFIEELKQIDVNSSTTADLESFFAQFEDTEEIRRIKEKLFTMKKLREIHPDDKELAEKVCGFKPMGPFKIEITPFALVLHFPNPIDFNRLWGSMFHTVAGFQTCAHVNIDGKDRVINIVALSIHKYKSDNLKVHEIRHAINKCLKAGVNCNGEYEDAKELDEWGQSAQTINEIDDVIKNSSQDRVTTIIEYQSLKNIKRFRDELLAKLSSFNPSVPWLSAKSIRGTLAQKHYKENHSGIGKDVVKILKMSFQFADEEIRRIQEGITKYDQKKEIEKAINALQILLEKGYSKSWILSYLATGENFLADWEDLAKRTPRK